MWTLLLELLLLLCIMAVPLLELLVGKQSQQSLIRKDSSKVTYTQSDVRTAVLLPIFLN